MFCFCTLYLYETCTSTGRLKRLSEKMLTTKGQLNAYHTACFENRFVHELITRN